MWGGDLLGGDNTKGAGVDGGGSGGGRPDDDAALLLVGDGKQG